MSSLSGTGLGTQRCTEWSRSRRVAKELGVARLHAVANKVRTEEDRETIERFCAARSLVLDAVLPYDEAVLGADRAGMSVLDGAPDSEYVRAVGRIADRLFS